MPEFQPTPYMAALIARLDRMCAIRGSLTAAERKEARRLSRSVYWAKRHWERYNTDPDYRERRRKQAIGYWQKHGRGAR